MRSTKKLGLLSFVVLVSLGASLIVPTSVLADDATPPPPEVPEIVDPVEPPPAAATEEAPPVEPPVTEEVVVEQAPTEEVVPPADGTLLEGLPAGTEVVILNADGQVEPLATQEAAAIIATGDPMWCPGSTLPGGAGCTGNATVAGLIPQLSGITGAGTIYFEATYGVNDAFFNHNNANLGGLTDLTIQGGWNGSTVAPDVSGITTFGVPVRILNWGGNVFVNDIVIDTNGLTWTNGQEKTGLSIDTAGNIVIDNVSIAGTGTRSGSNYRARLITTRGTGNVTVNDSTFSNNTGRYRRANDNNVLENGRGLYIRSGGDVTLTDVIADSNRGYGADIGGDEVSVTGGSFSDNGAAGLVIAADGEASLLDVVANWNDDNGADIQGSGVSVTGGSFSYNEDTGLVVRADGEASLLDVVADWNDDYGADVDGDSVSVTGGSFSDNGEIGLDVWSAGEITLIDVTADYNADTGALLNNRGAGGAGVTVTGGSFSENDGIYHDELTCTDWFIICWERVAVEGIDRGFGLDVQSDGIISVTDVMAEGNAGIGANLDNWQGEDPGTTPAISVTGGSFSNTTGATLTTSTYHRGCGWFGLDWCTPEIEEQTFGHGLFAGSSGDITLTDVTANGNATDGAILDNCMWSDTFEPCTGTGNIFVDPSTFNNNGDSGLVALSSGNITLVDVTANNNGLNGAVTYSESGTVTVACSEFKGNGDYGIDDYSAGAVYLNSVEFDGNALGEYSNPEGSVTIGYDPCGQATGDGDGRGTTLPAFEIPITGGLTPILLSCATPSVTLQIGDMQVAFTGLCGYSVILEPIVEAGLPGNLGSGSTFQDGVTITLLKDGQKIDVLPSGTGLSISSPAPEGGAAEFMIWNGSGWDALSSTTGEDPVVADLGAPGTVVLVTQ